MNTNAMQRIRHLHPHRDSALCSCPERLLPSLAALVDAPQLSSLALLELALLVVPRDLDLHQENLGALWDLVEEGSGDVAPTLLAQLISDRCRELGELTAAYRHALASSTSNGECDDIEPAF